MDQVFKDAQKFELYRSIKGYSDGYMTWAILGFVGSFLTYLLNIFGDAVKVAEDQLDYAIGGIWIFIIPFGIMAAFQMSPDALLESSKSRSKSEFIQLQRNFRRANIKIGFGWMLSFILAFAGVYLFDSLSPSLISGDPYLIGIALALMLGNLSIFLVFREAKSSLLVAVLIAATLILLVLSPQPYQQLTMGIIIGGSYYIGGFYIRVVDLPRVLRQR